METPHIFLDTEQFIRNNLDYKSRLFQRLIALCQSQTVFIHLVDITVKEIETHIKKDVLKASQLLKSKRKEKEIQVLKNISDPRLDIVFNGIDIDVDTTVEILVGQFRGFLKTAQVNIIPVKDVSIEDVFNKYFAEQPPFKEGNKKHEFPDAFMIEALKIWCGENKQKIYVISGDSDMVTACEEADPLIPLSNIEQFLDLVTARERFSTFANSLFDTHKKEIRQHIREAFDYINLWPYESDGEVQYTHIDSVKILKKYLIEVSERKAVFEVVARVNYSAKVSYHNYAMGMMMGMGMGYREELKKRSNRIQAEVSILLDIDNPNEFQIEYVHIKEDDVLLYPTEDDTFLDSSEDNY